MNIKDGLYLFPEIDKFLVYGAYLGNIFVFDSGSAGELLIDFLDHDFSEVFSIVKNSDAISGGEIFDTIENLEKKTSALFMIYFMNNHDWARAYDNNPNNWFEEYKAAAEQTLNSIISTHANTWAFADYYCERSGSAEERFDFFYALEEQFTTMAVEEIISARKPGKDFFSVRSKGDYCFPYTHAYRFNDLQNYVQFLFLNMMQNNPNFCKCNYCYRFFIPKTKKPTRFCDRIDPESGKACKEIAPMVYRNEDISSNKILKQYDLAARRNYMRMCRGEERAFGRSADRDLEPTVYFEWRDRAVNAMRLWKNKKLSDEEFLKVVGELD